MEQLRPRKLLPIRACPILWRALFQAKTVTIGPTLQGSDRVIRTSGATSSASQHAVRNLPPLSSGAVKTRCQIVRSVSKETGNGAKQTYHSRRPGQDNRNPGLAHRTIRRAKKVTGRKQQMPCTRTRVRNKINSCTKKNQALTAVGSAEAMKSRRPLYT